MTITSGFGARYARAVSDAVSSTTSTGFGSKAAISLAESIDDPDLVIEWRAVCRSTSGALPLVRLYNLTDGAVIGESYTVVNTIGIHTFIGGKSEFNPAGVAKTIQLQFASSSNGSQVQMMQAFLEAYHAAAD